MDKLHILTLMLLFIDGSAEQLRTCREIHKAINQLLYNTIKIANSHDYPLEEPRKELGFRFFFKMSPKVSLQDFYFSQSFFLYHFFNIYKFLNAHYLAPVYPYTCPCLQIYMYLIITCIIKNIYTYSPINFNSFTKAFAVTICFFYSHFSF